MTALPSPPDPLPGQSVAVTLAAHLERLILTGALPPGAKVPAERVLAQQFSVSRTSLREALRELESKDLVERRPGRGTIVLEAPSQVSELLALGRMISDQQAAAELRALVEPSIASIAASRAREANLLQLRDVLSRTDPQGEPRASLERDTEFHLLLAHATYNPLITALHGLITDWTVDLRSRSHDTCAGREISLSGHQEILAAVAAGEPQRASAAMRQHLEDVRRLVAGRDESSDAQRPADTGE